MPVPEDLSSFRRDLRDRRDHLFFNLTDPRMGEGRLIAMPVLMLEQEGCRYTGCSADALYLTSNKILAKRLMALGGIPAPRWIEQGRRPGSAGFGADFVRNNFV